jgi:hypothetical protein
MSASLLFVTKEYESSEVNKKMVVIPYIICYRLRYHAGFEDTDSDNNWPLTCSPSGSTGKIRM